MGGGILNTKNAFTLIELLAIIVILAIIAVITVPIILNIIENSRKGAATDSAYGYKDSVNKTYIAELQNHNKLKLDGTYTVKSDGSLEPTEDNTFGFGDSEYGNSLGVQVSGTVPSSGKLRYSNNVLNAGCVVIGDYKVTFGTDGKVDDTVKDDCESYEFPSTSRLTWNNYITPAQESGGSSLPTGSTVWIQENTITGSKEVCGILNEKTVCVIPNSNSYQDNFHYDSVEYKTSVSGYVADKKDEMETAGLFIDFDYGNGDCYLDDNNKMVCAIWFMAETYDWNNFCAIDATGYVECATSIGHCSIDNTYTGSCY